MFHYELNFYFDDDCLLPAGGVFDRPDSLILYVPVRFQNEVNGYRRRWFHYRQENGVCENYDAECPNPSNPSRRNAVFERTGTWMGGNDPLECYLFLQTNATTYGAGLTD